VAAVFTEFRLRSHAFHILTSLMGPYLFRGKWTDPGVDVVSFYADQFPNGDMAREASERFKVPLSRQSMRPSAWAASRWPSMRWCSSASMAAIREMSWARRCIRGKNFFDQIVAVVERTNVLCLCSNDKHLSYRWDWAKAMYDDARRLNMPFMAGSSVPLAERRPRSNFLKMRS